MNSALISIIIPAYNTALYLDRCMTSVCAQTYGNIEIILVNDGATDHTPALCDAWAEKDARVRVIHQANQGLAEVCNVGVKASKGEFIGFVDSDDWIEPRMFEQLYHSIQKYNSDISVCSVLLETESGKFLRRSGSLKEKVRAGNAALKRILIDKSEKSYRWNKLYRKTLFEGIVFPKNRVFEDLNTVYKLYAKAKAVSYTGTHLYHYIQRADSIIGAVKPQTEIDYFMANTDRFDFVINYPKFTSWERRMLRIRLIKRLLRASHKINKMTASYEYKDQKEQILQYMQKSYRKDFKFENYTQYILQNYLYTIPFLHLHT